MQLVLQPFAHLVPVTIQQQENYMGRAKIAKQQGNRLVAIATAQVTHLQQVRRFFKGHPRCQDQCVDDEVLVGQFVKQDTSSE